jgi:hypothetical protein
VYHSSDGGSGSAEKTTWEKYLKEERSKVKKTRPEEREEKEENDDVGFDDSFFQHDVTTRVKKNEREIERRRLVLNRGCSILVLLNM